MWDHVWGVVTLTCQWSVLLAKNCCAGWIEWAGALLLSGLVHCQDEFSMHQTAVWFIVYGEMHHGDV